MRACIRLAAFPLLAVESTRSATAVAAVTAAQSLPWLVFGGGLGVLLERSDRRRLMEVVDLARAAIIVGLAAAIITQRRAGIDLPGGAHHGSQLGAARHRSGGLRPPTGRLSRSGPGKCTSDPRTDRRQRTGRASRRRMAVRPGRGAAVRGRRRDAGNRCAAAHAAECLSASNFAGPPGVGDAAGGAAAGTFLMHSSDCAGTPASETSRSPLASLPPWMPPGSQCSSCT